MNFVDKDATIKMYILVHPWKNETSLSFVEEWTEEIELLVGEVENFDFSDFSDLLETRSESSIGQSFRLHYR